MGCANSTEEKPPKSAGSRLSKRSMGETSFCSIESHLLTSKEINKDAFKIEKVIGKGTFGKVMLVTKIDTQKFYAMKILKKEMLEKINQRQHTKNEREIFEATKDHPFIVKLRFAFQNSDKLYFVMDFMQGGELFSHLVRSGRFTEDRARFYTAEILLAMDFIHKQGIIYRDLKPENVLLDEEGHINITDFGLSKVGLSRDRDRAFTFCGTPEYLAPEIIKGVGHDQAVDYWSLGALLYQMLSGHPPFKDKNQQELFKMILYEPVEMQPFFSDNAVDLLTKLLNRDPEARIQDPETLQTHPFFHGMNWISLGNREISPPFKPRINTENDLQHFDPGFTDETPTDSVVISNLNNRQKQKNVYEGFTYKDPSHL